MDADTFWMAYKLAAKGQIEALHEYLAHSMDPEHDYSMAICAASCNGYIDIVRWLIRSPHINHEQTRYEAFTSSAMHGYLDILKLLFADPRLTPEEYSHQISHILSIAARNHHRAIVEFCLADPATDPNQYNCQAFNWANYRNNWEMASLILHDPRMNFYPAIYSVYITEPRIYRVWAGPYSVQRQNESADRFRRIKGELIERTCHPDRIWNWCLDEEKKRAWTLLGAAPK
jgi:hypothetical protein